MSVEGVIYQWIKDLYGLIDVDIEWTVSKKDGDN